MEWQGLGYLGLTCQTRGLGLTDGADVAPDGPWHCVKNGQKERREGGRETKEGAITRVQPEDGEAVWLMERKVQGSS